VGNASDRDRHGTGRIPPSNIQAEESLLGAMLLKSEVIEEASKRLTPDDFYKPGNGHVFAAITNLHAMGEPADPVTVAEMLDRMDMLQSIGGPAYLINLQAGTPATSNAARYAKIIEEHALLRRLIGVAGEIAEIGYDLPDDVPEALESARNLINALAISGITAGSVPDDVWILDEFLDRPDIELPPWCVEGLLRVGWRVMIVAGEGVGKTVLLRVIGMAAAQGVQPFTHERTDPVRTLIVDLENPDESIMEVCNPIREQAMDAVDEDYDPERAWLWHRPSGINLRDRADRNAFEAVLQHTKPDLVCMGPLYKVYEVGQRDNDEQAAKETMRVLDDFRTRYKFGLLLEHHAPKGSNGGKRELTPYGTSLWLRWPEIGINLNPESMDEGDFSIMKLGRWRGDRLKNQWPDRIRRGGKWLWDGEFNVDPTSFGRGPSNSLSGLEPDDDRDYQPGGKFYTADSYSYDDDDYDDDAFPGDTPF
jgi:hypothetical protein